MATAFFFVLLSVLGAPVYAAFGITTSDGAYTIDAGSNESLVFTVSRSSCDITSIKYRGTEVQYPGKGTHIGSGLGSATVEATVVSDKYAKVTCSTSTLTHYIIVSSGESTLYMATHITAEPDIGELRYIARLSSAVYPDEYPFGVVSTTAGSSATIEGSDVFLVDGQTRSKFYSSERRIDDPVHCVAGADNHACFVKPQYETSVGGPFFRDINSNNGGDYTSLTHYMNSGHANPEAFRLGLHGPYMLTFTRSGIPKVNDFDLSWLADLDLTGYVSSSGRGSISGTASGVGNNGVVHWSNTEAQYWAYVASDGSFKSPAMKSGTYITKLYSTELEVANSSIVVTAGPDTNQDIENSLPAPSSSLWTIGVCDGQPTGFLNADKQQRMHPSDARMSAWGPLTYAVGSSELSDMPMALFKGFNTPQTITFSLSSADASGGATLRVRTTLSFAGARPQVTVNSWSGPSQKSPVNLNSRGVTRGTYRGLGEFYEFEIPSGTLVSGENTVKVDVTSGSSGDAFLSPNFVLDCFELFR